MTDKEKDCIALVKSDLQFRERLFQLWGLTWEQAARCVIGGFEQWDQSEGLEVGEGFIGEAGYAKRDEQ